MWKLSIADDQGQRTTVNLVRDEYTVGRDDGNVIRLTERNVSRRHAVIRRTPSGFMLMDTSSQNGTFINGVRLNSTHELAHADVVLLGDYRIDVIDEELSIQEQAHRPVTSSAPPSSGRLPHRLVVLIGPNQGTEFALEMDRHLIGRGEECEFSIDHASVSRVHAEVRRIDADHFEILDKGSANGLRINSRELPRAVLDGRDVIEVGDVVLKYIPQGQIFRASPAEGARLAALAGAGVQPPLSKGQFDVGRSLLAAGLGAILAALLAGYYLFAPSRRVSPPTAVSQSVDGAQQGELETIAELARSDVEAAHERIVNLVDSELATGSQVVAGVESAWAKRQLELAARAPDARAKKALLMEVVQALTVPSELRQQAATALDTLNRPGLSLDELEAGPEPTEAPLEHPSADRR